MLYGTDSYTVTVVL